MQDLKEAIASSIDYIEENLRVKFSLDDIAARAGLSKYYLHRIFKSLTGQSIMEYAQARRLTSSITELSRTDERIIDIALDYGFEYEQSYIRAFRKKFGCTPMRIRTGPISLELTEKINVADILSVDNSITYTPRFVFMQKFYLIGEKHIIRSKSGVKTANAYGRDFFYHEKGRIGHALSPSVYYGYTDWSRDKEGVICYMPAARVSGLEHIPAGMAGIAVPAHKYVVFKFVGFFNPDEINGRHVGRLLVQLYRKWIFKSGYRFAAPFRFEYIDTAISKGNYCELDLYQPVTDAPGP